ncbi:unnamed protein product [Camellia sinensis]
MITLGFKLQGIRRCSPESPFQLTNPASSAATSKILYSTVSKSTESIPVSLFVPSRSLLDRTGNLALGAIVNLVDELGGTVIYVEGLPMNVSVDMSVSLLSTAKLTDELEITSRVLGQRGGCSGTIILIRNKATGKVVAEV